MHYRDTKRNTSRYTVSSFSMAHQHTEGHSVPVKPQPGLWGNYACVLFSITADVVCIDSVGESGEITQDELTWLQW